MHALLSLIAVVALASESWACDPTPSQEAPQLDPNCTHVSPCDTWRVKSISTAVANGWPLVNYISFEYHDGRTSSIGSPLSDDAVQTFLLEDDEVITRFEWRSGVYLDGFRITTNLGRQSPWYGETSGEYRLPIEVPAENPIVYPMMWVADGMLKYSENNIVLTLTGISGESCIPCASRLKRVFRDDQCTTYKCGLVTDIPSLDISFGGTEFATCENIMDNEVIWENPRDGHLYIATELFDTRGYPVDVPPAAKIRQVRSMECSEWNDSPFCNVFNHLQSGLATPSEC